MSIPKTDVGVFPGPRHEIGDGQRSTAKLKVERGSRSRRSRRTHGDGGTRSHGSERRRRARAAVSLGSRTHAARRWWVGCRRVAGWLMGSRCYRPLLGITPVPQSMPQSVSCIPRYHPGRRDFPDPVGSEDLSSSDLPTPASSLSDGAHTLLSVWFVAPLVHRVSFRLCRTLCSGRWVFGGPSSPRAPWLWM